MVEPPGFWLTFAYYFVVTNLIAVAIVSQRLGISWRDPSIYQIGILVGLTTGLLGANFNRNVTITIPIKRQSVFLKTLNEILTAQGFEETSQLEDFTVYQKSALATLFSGRVFVKIEGKTATIMGRASVIKKINLEY
jgi:hypothetical protein